eukprot:scaffold44240_cov59-Phaeocystis_antarctica.AAC.12
MNHPPTSHPGLSAFLPLRQTAASRVQQREDPHPCTWRSSCCRSEWPHGCHGRQLLVATLRSERPLWHVLPRCHESTIQSEVPRGLHSCWARSGRHSWHRAGASAREGVAPRGLHTLWARSGSHPWLPAGRRGSCRGLWGSPGGRSAGTPVGKKG